MIKNSSHIITKSVIHNRNLATANLVDRLTVLTPLLPKGEGTDLLWALCAMVQGVSRTRSDRHPSEFEGLTITVPILGL